MTIIDALKERLQKEIGKTVIGAEAIGRIKGLEQAHGILDSFQYSRTWHDPAEKLPEDGEAVWIEESSFWSPSVVRAKFSTDARIGMYSGFADPETCYWWPAGAVLRWTPRYVDTPPEVKE